MKRFEVYKNIRKRAVIFGLPVSLFAVMIIAIVISLLVIIFSFSFVIIIGVSIFNSLLYILLLRFSGSSQLPQLKQTFPELISSKQDTRLDYEED